MAKKVFTTKSWNEFTEGISTLKSKSDSTNIAYATCSTAAATAAKVVTVSGNEQWKLTIGSIINVKFSTSNSASNVTLNVNGTGAYPIWYNNAEYTSNGTAYTGYANRVITYMFNGTHWVWLTSSYDSNTTYTNVKLGHGYVTCSTAEATAAKVGTLSSYTLTTGGIVAVKFTYAVPANATLNINSKGAKSMYFRGAAISAGVIKAGDVATFIYNGSQYHLISIDRWQNDISTLKTDLDTKVPNTRTVNGKALSSNITLSASDVGAAESGHTHSEYANQNAFSNVKVGSTTVAADTATDTLEIAAGTGISVSGDTTNDKVTITNSGVRSISTGTANGTISVNTNGSSANVAVKGLGSAAYTASTAYDASGTAQTKADAALASAKSYTDTAISNLINSAPTTLDTLGEIATAMENNADVVDALEDAVGTKANASDLTSHTSNKSNPHGVTLSQLGVTATSTELNVLDGITATTAELNYVDGVTSNIQTQLNGKAASSHGTHVSYSTTAPVMDGTASVGSASTVARSDHKHPTDTSRASKTEFDTHVADTTKHITSTERTNWGAAYTHSQAAHAPSNAQANQNAFSNIAVSGQTTVAADTTTDTVTFAGSNVSITTNATSDIVTFSVADGSTSTKGLVKLTNSTSSTSTTTAATPSSVKSAYDLANQAKTAANNAQTTADGKANATHTHTKSEITDFPTIPTKTSQLTNDSGFKTTDNNTTYDFSATKSSSNGNVNLQLTGNNNTTDSVIITGSGGTTVTTDSSGVVTVNGTKITMKTWSSSDMV